MALLVAALPAEAGRVTVRFDRPERFTDAERGLAAERVRETLSARLQALGERWLPAQQTLTVDVLDIDLAGEPRMVPRLATELRVMRGGVDWPRIRLHVTLRDGDAVLADEDADVADIDYLRRLPPVGGNAGPLAYEQRMLDDWFRQRFAATSAAR